MPLSVVYVQYEVPLFTRIDGGELHNLGTVTIDIPVTATGGQVVLQPGAVAEALCTALGAEYAAPEVPEDPEEDL